MCKNSCNPVCIIIIASCWFDLPISLQTDSATIDFLSLCASFLWPWLSRGCSSAAPSKDLGRLTDYRRSSRPFRGFLSRAELPARPSPTLSVIDVAFAHLHLLYMQNADRTFWLFFPSLSMFLSLSLRACTTFRGLKTDDGVRGTCDHDKTSIFFNASRLDPSVSVPQHWNELGDQF